jgi:glutaconyl-CoA/methylmalonyl-CoA decarboxylase subunit delta
MLLSIDWAAALNLISFSFSMVFILLVFIILALTLFGAIVTHIEKKKKGNIQKSVSPPTTKMDNGKQGEVFAAIAMALHACQEDAHDVESNIITIEKVNKRYTPWSSKIYGLNAFGRKA